VRTFLLLSPAVLSLLALGAHFLRRGALPAVALCLCLVALLAVRRPWAARAVQAALVMGALVWARTLAVLVPSRQAAGEPWTRLAVILVAVAALAVGAALAFRSAALRRRYRLDGPAGRD
jgi:hypothetical protein